MWLMLSLQDIDNIVLNGGIVVDVAGEKIGSVEQIFTSGDSGDPVFVTVRTGLFGMSESFAPLSGASLEDSVIKVAFAKDMVKNGPRIDSDRGAITETQEQELYSYYGLDPGTAVEGSAAAESAAGSVTEDTAEEWPPGQEPPHRPPHPGPPPPPHLHKHVPLPPGPHPGPRTPHPPHPHHPPRPMI
jgi:hypothetical protein